jgi:SAM-dependent methyltransferase
VSDDQRRLQAASFGAVADAYERSRPEYPAEAVRWLTGVVPADVVDLGAGTGKLTRGLVALGHRVTAVEPLPEMRAHIGPPARVLAGSAEAIPLPDASADVIVCAQAFHWFDQPVALREIARVLRPGGRIGILWNVRDETVEWVAALTDAMEGRLGIAHGAEKPIAASGRFGPVECASFDHAQVVSREGLRELVRSRSFCAVMSEDQRAPVFERVDAIFDEHARDGALELPYITECFRATRS